MWLLRGDKKGGAAFYTKTPVRSVLTMAIQRTMCSSMKLLKYWLRNRRPGPIKAGSGRYNSLLVMCAIYREDSRKKENTG